MMIEKKYIQIFTIIIVSILRTNFCTGSHSNDLDFTTIHNTSLPILVNEVDKKEDVIQNFFVMNHIKNFVKRDGYQEILDKETLVDKYKKILEKNLELSNSDNNKHEGLQQPDNLIIISEELYELCEHGHIQAMNSLASILCDYHPDEALKWYLHAYQTYLMKENKLNKTSLRGIELLLKNHRVSSNIKNYIKYDDLNNSNINRLVYLNDQDDLLINHLKIDKDSGANDYFKRIYLYNIFFKNIRGEEIDFNKISLMKYNYAQYYSNLAVKPEIMVNEMFDKVLLHRRAETLYRESNTIASHLELGHIYAKNLNRSELPLQKRLLNAFVAYHCVYLNTNNDIKMVGLDSITNLYESNKKDIMSSIVSKKAYQGFLISKIHLFFNDPSPYYHFHAALVCLSDKLTFYSKNMRLDIAQDCYKKFKDKLSDPFRFEYNDLLGNLYSEGKFGRLKGKKNKIDRLNTSNSYLTEALKHQKNVDQSKIDNTTNLIEKNNIMIKSLISAIDENRKHTQVNQNTNNNSVSELPVTKTSEKSEEIERSQNKSSGTLNNNNKLKKIKKEPILSANENFKKDNGLDFPKKIYEICFLNKDVEKNYYEMFTVFENKIPDLTLELQHHPRTGLGRPEQLKGNLKNLWSRRITQEDRFTYQIDETNNKILIHGCKGHYKGIREAK